MKSIIISSLMLLLSIAAFAQKPQLTICGKPCNCGAIKGEELQNILRDNCILSATHISQPQVLSFKLIIAPEIGKTQIYAVYGNHLNDVVREKMMAIKEGNIIFIADVIVRDSKDNRITLRGPAMTKTCN